MILRKVAAIFNTEVREGEKVIVEQRPQEGQRMKPCEYLKEKHFRKNSTVSKKQKKKLINDSYMS